MSCRNLPESVSRATIPTHPMGILRMHRNPLPPKAVFRRPPKGTRARFLLAGLLLAATSAIAGSVVHTVTNDWSDGTKLNVDAAGDRLDLATVANQVDDWYRHPYNQIDWEAQAEKDTSTVFSEGDRCLRDSDNGTINGPTVDVTNSAASPETHEFRTGLVTKVYSGTQYVASVPATTEIPLPTGMSTIDEVRFLTGGARIAETSYTVRFHYSDTTISSVSVPIRIDTTTGAARNRSGVNYTIAGITRM